MFVSLLGVQVFVYSGADSGSQSAIPNQNAGCSMKLGVPPVPSCLGGVGGSVYVFEFPEPGLFE